MKPIEHNTAQGGGGGSGESIEEARSRELAAGNESHRAAELAGLRREGPESPAERAARIRDSEFPDYKWIRVREWTDPDPEVQALLNRRTLGADLAFPHQRSMSAVRGILVGGVDQTDAELTVSLRHEIGGHVKPFLAGTHPADPVTGLWYSDSDYAYRYHSQVKMDDALFAAQRGWYGIAFVRVQQSREFSQLAGGP